MIIPPENRQEFIDIYLLVKECGEKGKPVPYAAAYRIFELVYEEDRLQVKGALEQASAMAARTESLLKSRDRFRLEWKSRKLAGQGKSHRPGSQQIFTEIIYAFLLYKNENKKAGKDEAIGFFYEVLKSEYKSQILKCGGKSFSDYRLRVLSGMLTLGIGYKIVKGADPSNKDIWQATKYAIKKFEKLLQ